MVFDVIRKVVGGLFSKVKSSRGYTLTEVAAVVATAGIITTVALPAAVEQVGRGKVAKAQGDLLEITAAINNFIKDTGELPIRRVAQAAKPDVENRFFFTVLLSTRFEKKGTPGALPEAIPPQDNRNGDFFGGVNAGRIGTLETPLYTNRANDLLGAVGDDDGRLYNPADWRGPYLSRRSLDPWGQSYLIFLRGLRENALDPEKKSAFKLWLISAGPNGKLETDPTDESPRGDDIGVVASG